jgi:hypothetical protein
MWESVNTVIIRPQEIVPTARRKPSLRPQQHLAVDAPCRDQRQIFLEREIGDEGEKEDGDGLIEKDAKRECADHPPPRVGP